MKERERERAREKKSNEEKRKIDELSSSFLPFLAHWIEHMKKRENERLILMIMMSFYQ